MVVDTTGWGPDSAAAPQRPASHRHFSQRRARRLLWFVVRAGTSAAFVRRFHFTPIPSNMTVPAHVPITGELVQPFQTAVNRRPASSKAAFTSIHWPNSRTSNRRSILPICSRVLAFVLPALRRYVQRRINSAASAADSCARRNIPTGYQPANTRLAASAPVAARRVKSESMSGVSGNVRHQLPSVAYLIPASSSSDCLNIAWWTLPQRSARDLVTLLRSLVDCTFARFQSFPLVRSVSKPILLILAFQW